MPILILTGGSDSFLSVCIRVSPGANPYPPAQRGALWMYFPEMVGPSSISKHSPIAWPNILVAV